MRFLSKAIMALLPVLCGMQAQARHHNWQHTIDTLLQSKTPRTFNGNILIAKNDKIQYQKSYGYQDIPGKKALVADQQFIVASISKQITAALVLQQVAKGNIDRQAAIRRYLPDLPDAWADSITVHQLLCHTSGVVWTGESLAFAPGSKFTYSNYGYLLLGDILGKVTGKTYNELANNLFKEYGMARSVSYDPEGKMEAPKWLATGYAEQANGTFRTDDSVLWHIAPAAGGIISTVPDLLRWNTALHGKKILNDSCYRFMTTPSANRAHRWGTIGYGYGVQIDSIDGLKEISHNGYFNGYIATLLYYPASRTSIIILENISPDSGNMPRAFYFHDEIRKIVRQQLLD